MPDGWTVMAKIAIYTTNTCGFCAMAKDLLRRKGAQFEEIDVSYDAEQRTKMMTRAGGRRTVPQIFIGETHVGGCDDLRALDAKGGLDPLLAQS
jgi:glutaredoxin 3